MAPSPASSALRPASEAARRPLQQMPLLLLLLAVAARSSATVSPLSAAAWTREFGVLHCGGAGSACSSSGAWRALGVELIAETGAHAARSVRLVGGGAVDDTLGATGLAHVVCARPHPLVLDSELGAAGALLPLTLGGNVTAPWNVLQDLASVSP